MNELLTVSIKGKDFNYLYVCYYLLVCKIWLYECKGVYDRVRGYQGGIVWNGNIVVIMRVELCNNNLLYVIIEISQLSHPQSGGNA